MNTVFLLFRTFFFYFSFRMVVEVTAHVLTLKPRKLVPSVVDGAGRCLCTTVRSDFRALRALLRISCNSSMSFTGSLFTCCKEEDKRNS
jgi:hypothetical protein